MNAFNIADNDEFSFLIGAIKTYDKMLQWVREGGFSFLIGAIKTVQNY